MAPSLPSTLAFRRVPPDIVQRPPGWHPAAQYWGTPPPRPLPEADAAASASGRGKILLGVSGSADAPRRASGA